MNTKGYYSTLLITWFEFARPVQPAGLAIVIFDLSALLTKGCTFFNEEAPIIKNEPYLKTPLWSNKFQR